MLSESYHPAIIHKAGISAKIGSRGVGWGGGGFGKEQLFRHSKNGTNLHSIIVSKNCKGGRAKVEQGGKMPPFAPPVKILQRTKDYPKDV